MKPPRVYGALIWHLGDDSDNRAKDSTSNHFHGNLVGRPSIIEGKNGKSVAFDGIDDRLTSAYYASDLGVGGSAPRTLSIWTKYDGLNSEYGYIFAVGRMGGGCCVYQGFGLMEKSHNEVGFHIGGEWMQNASWNVTPDGSPNDVWVHYAAVYDGLQI